MGDLMLMTTNEFSFRCPIFAADVKFSSCVKLREKVWRGERFEKRRGCQACMASSKCPVSTIVQRTCMFGDEKHLNRYASEQPVMGKLHADVLQQILPIIITQDSIRRFGVPEMEVETMKGCNERIAAQIGHAPASDKAARRSFVPLAVKATSATKPTPVEDTKITTAAATGDLSAAIS